jgi:hypothetical protein
MMRTTLTLDDDVAAAISQRRRDRGTGLRDEVNELLRAGLRAANAHDVAARSEPYSLPTFDPGVRLIDDLRTLKEMLDDEDDARALR